MNFVLKLFIVRLLEFNPAYIAAEIEETTFQMFKETNSKYKNRIKSRVMNLRDKRNTALKTMIIEGDIAPARFANMTAEVCFHLSDSFVVPFRLYFLFICLP